MTRLRWWKFDFCWRKFDFGWRKPTAESLTNRNVVFSKSVPFSKMKFAEHKFDRLDEIIANKPICRLIDDDLKPNLGY